MDKINTGNYGIIPHRVFTKNIQKHFSETLFIGNDEMHRD